MMSNKICVYNRVVPGAICYLPRAQISEIAKKSPVARTWTYGGKIRSAIVGNLSLRALENFSEGIRISEEGLNILIDDARKIGSPPPSSWSSIWGNVIQPGMPRCRKPLNWALQPYFSGGWNAKLADHAMPGSSTYDLVSAYAWAGYRFLPVPGSATASRELGHDGLYLIRGTLPKDIAYPAPWKPGRNRMLVTLAEMELYGVKNIRVLWGCRFFRSMDLRPHMDRIMNLCHYSKNILRAYWGRWAATSGVECAVLRDGTLSKKWTLPPVSQNFLWAHLITSRVRARVWEFVRTHGGSHVFTDSVLTDAKIREGFQMGDWRRKDHFKGHLYILGAGRIKDDRGNWIKHSGVSLGNGVSLAELKG